MQPKSTGPHLLFCTAAFLVVGLAGCPGPTTRAPTGPSSRPHEGVVVRVACPDERTAALVANYAPAWGGRAGGGVEVVRYDTENGPEKGPAADAWVLPPATMPHWAAAGQLLPVPAEYTTSDGVLEWSKLLPEYRDKLLVWDHSTYALPLLGEAPLCFYRADLFQAEANQAAFQKEFHHPLAAPETWEEYADIAQFFNGRKEGGLAGPSLPPLPERDDDLDREFFALAVPAARPALREDDRKPTSDAEAFSFHYDLQTLQPRIATPGFVHALRLLRRLQDYRPAGTAAEPAQAFDKGQAVLCLADASWIDRFRKGAAAGKFGICRLPGSGTTFAYSTGQPQTVPGGNFVPYLGAGGAVAVVPRSAEHPEAAFALLAELAGPQVSRRIVIEPRWGGGAFRRDHLEKTEGWYSFQLGQSQTSSLVENVRKTLLHSGIKNPVLRLRIPDERTHQRVLLAEVRRALTEGVAPAQALEAAAKRWRELDQAKDARRRQADYWLSLSLLPPG
jgi:multiple sugar transport system substrate-binding protein